MASQLVSDSEGEDIFDESLISQSLLRSAIRQRKATTPGIQVKRTNLLSPEFRNLFDKSVGNYINEDDGEETKEHDDLNDTEDHAVATGTVSTNERVTPILREALKLVPTEYTRPSRRRNISIKQQHIYTIDCVGYNLGVSKERAAELVSQNPQFVEMYHNGTLIKFLKGGKTKAKSKSKPKASSGKGTDINKGNTDQESQDLEDIQPIDNESDEESYTETDNSSNSNSSDSSLDSDDSDTEPSSSQIYATVKGRTYNNLDAISRGAKLPRSFFALQEKKTITVSQTAKKRKVQEERVGLAKKKKGGASSGLENDFRVDDIYTIAEESLEKDLNAGDRSVQIVEDTSDQEIIEVPDENSDDDLLMFTRNLDSETTFFRTGERFYGDDFNDGYRGNHLNDSYDDDGAAAVEDTGAEIKTMLAPVSRAKKGQDAKRSKVRTSKSGSTRVKRFKRTPLGSTRRTRAPPTSSSITAKPSTPFGKPTTLKASRTVQKKTIFDHYNRTSRAESALKYVGSDDDDGGGAEESEKITQNSTKGAKPIAKKVKRIPNGVYLFSPSPNVELPRSANVSTTIYEGLSDKYALVKKPVKSHLVINEKPAVPIPVFDDEDNSAELRGHFRSSKVYKILFEKSHLRPDSEVTVILGSHNLKLSRLLPNTEEKLNQLFTLLLEPGVLKSSSATTLIDSMISTIEFCSDITVNEAKSLITIIDNFKFKLEAQIRRKGQIRDIEFYYLGVSNMLYFCCHRILQNNYLSLFDYESKSKEVNLLFFSFVAFLDGSVLNKKLKEQILFSESISMLFAASKDEAWFGIQMSDVNDMEFFKSLCGIYEPREQMWSKVRSIMKYHLSDTSHVDEVRRDFYSVEGFTKQLGWSIDEETLSLMFECLKRNKFQNLPGESNHPVIFSIDGINRDTMVNLYLNILLKYSKSQGKLSLRLLEKIIPVSKVSSTDIVTFCNRVNILLCLSLVFKKNLEPRIGEILNDCDYQSKIMTQRVLKVIQTMTKINNENKIESKFPFLKDLIDSILSRKEYDVWTHFVNSISLSTLLPKTQKNFMSVISKFQNSKFIMGSCSTMIKSYISSVVDEATLNFIKTAFGSINPNLFPDLWCHVSGLLVSNGLENWSRLIQFQNFDDEAYIFSYILKHSGLKIYHLEKETFTTSLIKCVIKKNFSPSTNTFMKEISQLDPTLLSIRNLLIQTHRLQITSNLITTVLRSESLAAKSRYLSLVVSFLKYELDSSPKENRAYTNYAFRIVESINQTGYEYVRSSNAFEQLCSQFKIERRLSNEEVNQLINSNGNINESLRFIQTQLIESLKSPHSSTSFAKKFVPLLMKHSSAKLLGPNEQITDSKLYALCCSISINISLLSSNFPTTCWVFIHELIKTLYSILRNERNLKRVDFYAILSTLKSFPYIFNSRNATTTSSAFANVNDYQLKLEILTLTNIYRIFIELYKLLSGTNDLDIFIELTEIFTSSRILNDMDDNYIEFQQSNFLMKAPDFIKDLIIDANITNEGRLNTGKKLSDLKEALTGKFNEFVRLVEDYQEETDEAFLSD